eukprot:COSAG06_NODE_17352_length_946_cov_1.161747_1_plen_196_part_00
MAGRGFKEGRLRLAGVERVREPAQRSPRKRRAAALAHRILAARLELSPQPNGTLRGDHITRYAELGDWLRECYSTPAAESTTLSGGRTMTFTVPHGKAVDRVVIKEDLTTGQRVRSFTVTTKLASSDAHPNHSTGIQVQTVANGTSIGNKFIALLDRAYPAGTTLSLSIDHAAGAPAMTSFGGAKKKNGFWSNMI